MIRGIGILEFGISGFGDWDFRILKLGFHVLGFKNCDFKIWELRFSNLVIGILKKISTDHEILFSCRPAGNGFLPTMKYFFLDSVVTRNVTFMFSFLSSKCKI